MSRADGLYTAVQRKVINQMLRLAASDDKAKIVKAFRLAEKITPDQYKGSVRFVADKVKDDHPALFIAKHVSSRLSPRCRDAFIECLIVNNLLRGVAKRKDLVARTGMCAPTTILMSPTMRCNLTCDGCYAAEYSPDKDLERALLQKIVDEGNDMGVYLFHAARRRALHVRGAARFRARQQGRLLPGLHERHAPRPRHHRRARRDRQHRADAQPRGLARAHRPAPGRWSTRSGHGDHGPPRARPAWCSATPAPSAGTTGRRSSATSSSTRSSPRARCSVGTFSTCRSVVTPTRR